MAIYIDTSQGSNGTGTILNPYNSFTEINALTGDQSGEEIFLKCDTVSRLEFAPGYSGLNGCYNYRVSSYGDGELPIIKCSDIEPGTWTAESSLYYLADANGHRAVWADGVLLAGVANKVDLTENQSWFDDINDRIYIILDGTDPNTVEIELQAVDRDKCLRAYQSNSQTDDSNITLEQLCLVGGYDSLWISNVRGNVIVQDMIIKEAVQRDSNASGAGAGDGAIIYALGAAAAVPTLFPKGFSFRRNACIANQHCGLEVWGFGEHVIEKNTFRDNGCGCEYFGYMRDGRFSQNVVTGSGDRDATFSSLGNSLFVKGSNVGAFNGQNTGTLIERNILQSAQDDSLEIQNGSFEVAFNYIEGGREASTVYPCFFQDAASDATQTDIYLHHNLIHSDGTSSRMVWASGTPPTTKTVAMDARSDFNHYWTNGDVDHWSVNTIQTGTTNVGYSTHAAYLSGVSFDQNSEVTDPNRFFVDLIGGDYRIRSDAPLRIGPESVPAEFVVGNMLFNNGKAAAIIVNSKVIPLG